MALLANIHRGKGKRAFTVDDFMPQRVADEAKNEATMMEKLVKGLKRIGWGESLN